MGMRIPASFGSIRLNFTFRGLKFYIGILLGVLSLLLSLAAGASFAAAAVLGGLFFVLAPLRVTCGDLPARLAGVLWVVMSGIVGLVLTQLMLNADLTWLDEKRIFLGCVCIWVPVLFFLLCTGSCRIATAWGLLVPMLLTTVNYFVFAFRGNEFAPYDILAVGTAMDVAGQYTFSVEPPFAYAWSLGGAFVFACFCFPEQARLRGLRSVAVVLVAEIAAVAVLLWGIGTIEKRDYSNMGTVYNGYVLNFLCRMDAGRVDQPEGYDADRIEELEKAYDTSASPEERPNIIVIMNESFADLSVVGDLRTNTAVTPFYDSLMAETIHGYALCSTIGGGTCNSEYQFLTGNNMGFLPDGAYPYQQYIKSDTWSMFAALESFGYSTLATHPEKGNNWMRATVYPRFGVDTLYFTERYPHENLIRSFVSDGEMYSQMTAWYEERLSNQPQFMFGITMQNHGGYAYDWETWDEAIQLEGYSREYRDAEQYLYLLNQSDRALEQLVAWFEGREEPVVILFFGDHLPSLEQSFYEELHGGPFDTLQAQMKQYMVPFFVWANYEINARDVGMTGLNFLSNYVYEAAGLPLPAYNAFLKDVQAVIPAMNAFGYYSKSRGEFVSYGDAAGEEASWLEKYRILQYNAVFDKENRSDLFFPIPEQ